MAYSRNRIALIRDLEGMRKILAKTGPDKKRLGIPACSRKTYGDVPVDKWLMDFHWRIPRIIERVRRGGDMGQAAYDLGKAAGIAIGVIHYKGL